MGLGAAVLRRLCWCEARHGAHVLRRPSRAGQDVGCHSRGVTPIEDVHMPTSSADSPAPGSHAPLTGDLSVVVGSLHEKYDDPLGPVLVDSEIQQIADRFTHARIRAFVPLFVRRFAGARLRDHSARRGDQLPAGKTPELGTLAGQP
jgi:hypothetical protein